MEWVIWDSEIESIFLMFFRFLCFWGLIEYLGFLVSRKIIFLFWDGNMKIFISGKVFSCFVGRWL